MSTINYQSLLSETEIYARHLFDTNVDDKRVYHNLSHTEAVVYAATQMASHYDLNEADFFVVIAAAWFHDIGYFLDASNHEAAGAKTASAYLQQQHVDMMLIQKIEKCILATKLPQQPESPVEQIVCDADLFHLGTDEFPDKNKLMRKEVNAFCERKISKEEWRMSAIKLLETHHYHTDYAKLLLDKAKQNHLSDLKSKAEASAKNIAELLKETDTIPSTDTTPKTKTPKDDKPSRGIETMFRISSGNHQKLSDQADSKSQILITVNSIIISVLLSVLLRTLEEYPHLKIPAFMLLAVNVVTIVCAIIATRPNLPPGNFTQQDIDEKKVNLLFFGNFYNMSLKDYTGGMKKMMDDRDFLYGRLIRDVYAQGVVLGKKYKMLRVAYNIFMYGLIVSVLGFVIAVIAAF